MKFAPFGVGASRRSRSEASEGELRPVLGQEVLEANLSNNAHKKDERGIVRVGGAWRHPSLRSATERRGGGEIKFALTL